MGGTVWSYVPAGITNLSLAGTLTKVGGGTLTMNDTAGK